MQNGILYCNITIFSFLSSYVSYKYKGIKLEESIKLIGFPLPTTNYLHSCSNTIYSELSYQIRWVGQSRKYSMIGDCDFIEIENFI